VGHTLAIGRLVSELCGACESANKRTNYVRIFLGPALAQRQYLFRNVRHDLATKVQDIADTQIDGHRIPGCADAEPVHVSAGEALNHIRWRQHHEAHVFVRIDATGRHPVPELIIVIGKWERHSKGERLESTRFALRHDACQCPGRYFGIGPIAIARVP
jgi:hypothetical protein